MKAFIGFFVILTSIVSFRAQAQNPRPDILENARFFNENLDPNKFEVRPKEGTVPLFTYSSLDIYYDGHYVVSEKFEDTFSINAVDQMRDKVARYRDQLTVASKNKRFARLVRSSTPNFYWIDVGDQTMPEAPKSDPVTPALKLPTTVRTDFATGCPEILKRYPRMQLTDFRAPDPAKIEAQFPQLTKFAHYYGIAVADVGKCFSAEEKASGPH